MTKCLTCGSSGFERSALGPHRCTFCDGTEGGHPPTAQEAAVTLPLDELRTVLKLARWGIEQSRDEDVTDGVLAAFALVAREVAAVDELLTR